LNEIKNLPDFRKGSIIVHDDKVRAGLIDSSDSEHEVIEEKIESE